MQAIFYQINISIHALLAESDELLVDSKGDLTLISIHALLAESDIPSTRYIARHSVFLSTLSLRRATMAA